MRWRLLVVAGLMVATGARPAGAQLKGVRFEIVSVGDSTLVFKAGTEHWIKRGAPGSAIDPRKRDVLVAKLRVTNVSPNGMITALVTGQTTTVSMDHVVLLRRAEVPWYRRRTMWGAFLAGAALGVVIGKPL